MLVAACFLVFPVFTAVVLLLPAPRDSEPVRDSEPEVPLAA